MKKLTLLCLLLWAFTACQKKDINALKSEINNLKSRVTRLEDAAKTLNTDIASLKTIAVALEAKVSVVSYTATATGYELTMSDGRKINLSNGKDGTNGTNGKDGINAPAIGLKQDADGNYYWTIGGDWLLQNGQKVKANGTNGTNGANGTTPMLMVNATSNQWMVSYDNGNTWSVIKDGNGNPIAATGATGPTGPQGQPGTQGAAGVAGFGITETNEAVIITYGGSTYTLPKGSSAANLEKITFATGKSLGSAVSLFIDAAVADRANVWIDLNNNTVREANENISVFGDYSTFTIASTTVTIYGKVTGLVLISQEITLLDVSKNTALTVLNCPDNRLTALDVSKNIALTGLYCGENPLHALDVSKNIALKTLYCDNNLLSALDLSKNAALEALDCSYNQLPALDVSKNIALKTLYCTINHLSVLDVSKNTALNTLYCSYNQLSALNVSQNIALTELRCYKNAIKDAQMTALINSLPTTGARIYIYDESGGENNTLPTSANITTANSKGWTVYKYNGSAFVPLTP